MMNMHGPYTLFDLGITDPAIIDSLSSYNNSPFTAGGYAGLLSPSENSSCKTDEIPPRVRHDGTSPLPLGMDWSPPPPVWDGKNTVWPHDYRTGWSYCVTIPSWTLSSDCRDSESVVLYKVLVGIQSPQGITTTREIQRRFSDFVTLSSDLRKEFPKKKLPPAPRKGLLRIKNNNLLEERRRLLEDWMTNVLSDIDLSRSLQVAIFVELEAAVRSSFDDSNNNVLDEDSSVRGIVQDEKLQAVSTNCSILEENETLRRELDAAHQQLKNLQNHTLEMDSESTTDLKLPVKLLHECLNLRTRLEECSISFHIENENVLIMETPSPSDALVTSDDQIDLLLAEAELLAQDVGGDSEARDAGLRKMLTDLLMDNARLRKQMNSVVRCAMSAPK